MPTYAQRFLGPLQDFSITVRALRAPLLLASLSLLVLSTPDQILELYLILAHDWSRIAMHVALAVLSLAALSLIIVYVSRSLACTQERVDAISVHETAQGAIMRTMPIMLALLPLVGCAIGLYRALQSTSTPVLRHAVETIAAFKTPSKVIEVTDKIQAALGGKTDADYHAAVPKLGELLTALVPQVVLELPSRTAELTLAIYTGIGICAALALLVVIASRQGALHTRVFHPVTTCSMLVLFIAMVALFAAQYLNVGRAYGLDFTSVPRTFGTLTLVNLSLIFIVFLCSLLTRWSDRHKIPLLSPLVALAFAFSLFNWNDNHSIRLTISSPDDLTQRKLGGNLPPYLFDAFDAWFASRPAEYKKKFEGKPYPIYVVAAQGGGMYAANLSGLTLARIYDRCPAIRHHLFAISGVSGGSVGAGYFAALLNDPAMVPQADTCALEAPAGGKGPLERKMEELLRADFLSPVAANFLFADLLQRFIPYPIQAFDRARAFEAGLETAWDSVMKSPTNPLRMPFWRHWRPDGAAPMLLLNTTIVESGQQVAVAPIQIAHAYKILGLESLQRTFDFQPEIDVPLSTAMSLSARFPLVMPAGLVELSDREMRLVDGGYFENSGAEAAMDLTQQLQRHLCPNTVVDYSKCEKSSDGAMKSFAFRIVVLTDFDEQANFLRDPAPARQGLNEILSPVRTMLNASIARGELLVGPMHNFSTNLLLAPNTIPTVLISLNQRLYHLPLGWQLSAQVQNIISAQIGDPANCGYGADAPAWRDAYNTIRTIEGGLELFAAGKPINADAVAGIAMFPIFGRRPFENVLFKLKSNQCAMFDVLGGDGVAPRKSHCKTTAHKVELKFQINPPPEFNKFDEAIEPYVVELKKRWTTEVEQKYGKAWANVEKADDRGHSCGGDNSTGNYGCVFSGKPCDLSYYQFVE